jgi:Fe-S-cluster containining protein
MSITDLLIQRSFGRELTLVMREFFNQNHSSHTGPPSSISDYGQITRYFIVKSPSHEIGYMVKFECDLCGRCCRSFGEFIRIERQLSSRDYYCRFGITRELFLAHTEPEYADTIAEEYEQQEGSGKDNSRKKCIFLQKDLHGDGFACAIYQNRPSICREFQCYRMVIYNHDRHVVGTVIGRNELKTADENLAKLWKEKVAHLPVLASNTHSHLQQKHLRPDTESHIHGSHRNDSAWAETVVAILKTHGYYGEIVE